MRREYVPTGPSAPLGATTPLRVGQTLVEPLFNELMRVETVTAAGNNSWVVGLVGAQSERFRRVTMTEADLSAVAILDGLSIPYLPGAGPR